MSTSIREGVKPHTSENKTSNSQVSGRRSGEILLAQIPSLQRAELSIYLAHLGPTAGVCVVLPGGGVGAPGTPRVVSGGVDDRMVSRPRILKSGKLLELLCVRCLG